MRKMDLEKDIGHKIRCAHNAIDKYFNNCWERAGVKPTRMQCVTMRYLREHDDVDVFQKDLEEAFSITGATATNILKLMEKEGLITRVAMPYDARLKKIELTEKGLKLDTEAHANVARLENSMKNGFTEEELTLFRQYLDQVVDNIGALLEAEGND